jgi:hypothetical protein
VREPTDISDRRSDPRRAPVIIRPEGLSVDPTLFLLLLIVVLGAIAAAAVASRRRRDAALEPTRLGPSWTPSVDEDHELPEDQRADHDRQVSTIADRTGLERDDVETVLVVWQEYLAVLGLTRLPATHRYRLYDPYNPPVARRDADGRPTPDRERVARDVGNRTDVAERDAETVLAAVEQIEQPDARP